MRLLRDPAIGLAALRIVVCALVLLNPATQQAVQLAAMPHPAAPIEGLWSLGLPVTPLVARGLQITLVASLFFALVGVFTRPALGVAAVTATYVLGLPQRHGNVIHHHHLVWLLALLACAPCGDAWAWDAPDERPRDAREYALHLAAARLLFGFVYLFPGVWKLRELGLEWALSDNLRNQLWWKWTQYGFTPAFRVDRHPWLLRLLGLGTLAFELSFFLLVLPRRTRRFALACGLAFHVGTAWLMRIDFPSLWLCYVGLWGDDELPRVAPPRALVPAMALLALVAVQGLRGRTRAWPIACYPTFQSAVGDTMPDLLVTSDDGRDLWPLPRTQAEWGIAWSLAGLQGPLDEARLRAFVRDKTSGSARVERVWRSVVPEERGRIVRRELLLSL